MNALIPFTFDTHALRTVSRNGEPWFFLIDVCRVLELSNPSMVASRLDDDEKATLSTAEGMDFNELGVVGAMPIVINESGLYSIILTSRKPQAKRFKKWVTNEVIPAIRKTGGYNAPDPMAALSDPTTLRTLLLGYSEKVVVLEAQNASLTGTATAYDRIATANGSLAITDAAKTLQVRPRDLFAWLREHHWIYRRAGAAHDVGYQSHTSNGDLEHKIATVERSDGSVRVTEQVRVTPKGITRLAKLLPDSMLLIPRWARDLELGAARAVKQ